jgi:hypothetical protein
VFAQLPSTFRRLHLLFAERLPACFAVGGKLCSFEGAATSSPALCGADGRLIGLAIRVLKR